MASAAHPAPGQSPSHVAQTAEVFTLGLDGGDVFFQSIQSVSFSEDGMILVLDRLGAVDPAVTVVSASGDVMARWGRLGDGPGELKAGGGEIIRAVFVAPDTVALASAARAGLYTWRGEELVRYQLGQEHLPESLLAADRGDGLGGAVRAIAFVAGQVVTWKLGMDYAKIGEMAASGDLMDLDQLRGASLYTFGPWDQRQTWISRPAPPAFDLSLTARFAPKPLLASMPGKRVVVGFGDEYVLQVLSGESGDTIGRIAREVSVRRPTRAFVRSATERDDDLDSFSLIKDAFWGPPGALWVERDLGIDDEFAAHLEHWRTSRLWDVFDVGMDGGKYLGAVSLPEGFSPLAGNDNLLAGRVTDELGQSGLRVLRVEIPGIEACC